MDDILKYRMMKKLKKVAAIGGGILFIIGVISDIGGSSTFIKEIFAPSTPPSAEDLKRMAQKGEWDDFQEAMSRLEKSKDNADTVAFGKAVYSSFFPLSGGGSPEFFLKTISPNSPISRYADSVLVSIYQSNTDREQARKSLKQLSDDMIAQGYNGPRPLAIKLLGPSLFSQKENIFSDGGKTRIIFEQPSSYISAIQELKKTYGNIMAPDLSKVDVRHHQTGDQIIINDEIAYLPVLFGALHGMVAASAAAHNAVGNWSDYTAAYCRLVRDGRSAPLDITTKKDFVLVGKQGSTTLTTGTLQSFNFAYGFPFLHTFDMLFSKKHNC